MSTGRRLARGFSLIEVVVALVILGMLTTSLFAIIRGSVKGAAEIEKLQRETDQVNRFLEICRQIFQSMPNSSTLSLTLLDANVPEGPQELGIAGMPTAFSYGLNPVSYQETVIGLRPDLAIPTTETGTPRYVLSITREDIIPETDAGTAAVSGLGDATHMADEQGRYWMPLLPNVANLHWRFFKESTDEWLEEWESTTPPDLVEIQLLMVDRITPLRLVYALPEKTLRAGSGRPATTTTTTPGNNTNNGGGGNGQQGGNNNAGGGGNQGGGNSGAPPAPGGR